MTKIGYFFTSETVTLQNMYKACLKKKKKIQGPANIPVKTKQKIEPLSIHTTL